MRTALGLIPNATPNPSTEGVKACADARQANAADVRDFTSEGRIRWCILVVVALAMGTACGTDSEGHGTSPTAWDEVPVPATKITVQQPITLSEFDDAAEPGSDLKAVSQGLDIDMAGKLENDHNGSVIWGEGLLPDQTPVGAVKICDAQGCSSALQGRKNGKIFWLDPNGAETTMRSMGQPALLKDLDGHDLDDPTFLVPMAAKGLGITIPKDDVPPIDFEKRRFLALNTFGDLLDTNLDEVTDAVLALGTFDIVEEIQYVREDTVRDSLRALDNFDAMVWVSQGVREARKTGVEYRTVGLTVNRAVYGETLLTRQNIEEMYFDNVANGPGILFLAASNSHSDGHPDQPETSSLWKKLEDTDRILIGVKGHAETNAIIRSAAVFFDNYLRGGIELGDAIKEANTWLSSSGAQLLSNHNESDTKGESLRQTYFRSYDDVWPEAPMTPSSIRLIVPIAGTPQCGTGDGPKSPKKEDFATSWADITFDGAYFEGSRKVDNQNQQVDTHIRGVLTGFEEGDHVYVETFGNMEPQFQDFHAFGIGTIQKAELNDEGKFVIEFTGPAHVAEYRDEDNQDCVLVSPSLATTTGGPATLTLQP